MGKFQFEDCEWGQGASGILLKGGGPGPLPLPQGGQWISPLPPPAGSLSLTPGISLIMWNAFYTAEKVIIRWTLLTEACYFGVQFLGES